MTDYHLKPPQDPPLQPWQEAKKKRQELLAEVRRRRAEQYSRFRQKNRQLQVSGDLV